MESLSDDTITVHHPAASSKFPAFLGTSRSVDMTTPARRPSVVPVVATFTTAGLLLLGACSAGGPDTSPPAQAAEIMKTQVRSPDSFKSAGGEVIWKGVNREGRPAYVTTVAFDSQDSAGAVVRSCVMVAYHEGADGKAVWDRSWGIKDYTAEMPMLCQKHVPMEIKSSVGKSFADLNFKNGNAEPAA
jgi:hypothetical protein